MDNWLWSLQLRDSYGFTPYSLLISPDMFPGKTESIAKVVQVFILAKKAGFLWEIWI
jgi:hypothetical protein